MLACKEALAPRRYHLVRQMRQLRICGHRRLQAAVDAGLRAASGKIFGKTDAGEAPSHRQAYFVVLVEI
jgi:hypothetical protein